MAEHPHVSDLPTFAAACHDILTADPGPGGRRRVCGLLEQALRNKAFAAHLGDGAPEREVLYEDPDLGFAILGHVYTTAKQSPPHDHGPTWAIYGQAEGETLMTDWALIEPPHGEVPGKVRRVRDYTLTPGMAYLYNEGDLHSPARDGPTKLIRIEGINTDGMRRARYEAAQPAT
jgi:predicted metal-dependent enzyme (double-stranded beta helix superfamily)